MGAAFRKNLQQVQNFAAGLLKKAHGFGNPGEEASKKIRIEQPKWRVSPFRGLSSSSYPTSKWAQIAILSNWK